MFPKKICEVKYKNGIPHWGKDLSEQEKMIMMKSGAQFLHVRLCLIQMAHISLQKTSTMRKCICDYQVRGLIRGGILYKSDSVLKVNNLHLGLCFVETHIRITTLFLAQRYSCIISSKCMGRHSSCIRLSKLKVNTCYRKSWKIHITSWHSNRWSSQDFRERVSYSSSVVWYGLPRATDL